MLIPDHANAFGTPGSELLAVTEPLLDEAVRASRAAPRRRVIVKLHLDESDPLQRMLNALQPGTYVRPHRHRTPPRAESLVILRGRLLCVIFGDDGAPTGTVTLDGTEEGRAVDIRPGIWHTLVALEADTVVFEAKAGPYSADTDKEFAPWAPAEGDPGAGAWLATLLERTRGAP